MDRYNKYNGKLMMYIAAVWLGVGYILYNEEELDASSVCTCFDSLASHVKWCVNCWWHRYYRCRGYIDDFIIITHAKNIFIFETKFYL